MALIDDVVKADTEIEGALELDKAPQESEEISIDLSATNKKRINIDGDPTRVLELNISDMNILVRLEKVYPKLEKLSRKAAHEMVKEEDEEDTNKLLSKMSATLTEIDTEMRTLMDELFDTNVSEVCAPSGSMYDLFYGKFRYEYIIEALMALYDTNMKKEYSAMKTRMDKHTSKYTKKKF